MTLSPGSRGFVVAMVTAQILTQIGAFTLPALLPEMMVRWSLSATEAGWLIGVFFAAYVPAVPVLLSLTDRVPARRRRIWALPFSPMAFGGGCSFARVRGLAGPGPICPDLNPSLIR